MQWTRGAAQVVRAIMLVAAVAGCTLPRSGPTAREILSAGDRPEYALQIVDVTPSVAAATTYSEALGFAGSFTAAGPVSADRISPGDTLGITVWENVAAGLLAGAGERTTSIEQIQVDESGQIFMPYVGRLRAGGRTPEELRNEIAASLQAQTPDPQVEVRRLSGDGTSVSVLGGVRDPGIYPIETPTRRLSSMLARAGGVTVVAEVAQVKLERAGQTGRVWLQDLYDDPRLDVALRSDDRIIVEQDRRSFTALGATGEQARIGFNKRDMSVIEALAASGGLDGRSADPTGIFVFRLERADIAARVTGNPTLVGPQRMAYIIDMTKPEGLFAAREFIIRDEDTIYVTEAPLASWQQLITLTATVVSLTGSVAAISSN